jgi:hypothetical protein
MHTATNVGGDFEIVGDDVYPLPSPPPAPSPSPTRRTIRRTPARCTSGGFCRGLRGYDAFTRWASSIAISASTISSFRATPLLDRSSAISRAGGGTISRPKSARNPSSVPRGQPKSDIYDLSITIKGQALYPWAQNRVLCWAPLDSWPQASLSCGCYKNLLRDSTKHGSVRKKGPQRTECLKNTQQCCAVPSGCDARTQLCHPRNTLT